MRFFRIKSLVVVAWMQNCSAEVQGPSVYRQQKRNIARKPLSRLLFVIFSTAAGRLETHTYANNDPQLSLYSWKQKIVHWDHIQQMEPIHGGLGVHRR
jgi:hypothetical protein